MTDRNRTLPADDLAGIESGLCGVIDTLADDLRRDIHTSLLRAMSGLHKVRVALDVNTHHHQEQLPNEPQTKNRLSREGGEGRTRILPADPRTLEREAGKEP